eukprot:m.21918 g.21918  ORF g.21918 m.21918 type:complete len:421 (-) comp10802_c0_seq1:50-1312(-)
MGVFRAGCGSWLWTAPWEGFALPVGENGNSVVPLSGLAAAGGAGAAYQQPPRQRRRSPRQTLSAEDSTAAAVERVWQEVWTEYCAAEPEQPAAHASKRSKCAEEDAATAEDATGCLCLDSDFDQLFPPAAGPREPESDAPDEVLTLRQSASRRCTRVDSPGQLVERLVRNASPDHTARLHVGGRTFLVPPAAAFVQADLAQWARLLAGRGQRFNIIVMDPPWENKSAQRSGRYRCLDHGALATLPVPQLLRYPSGLVAVWVTNKAKHIAFLKNVLFQRWQLRMVGEWFWVKLTQDCRNPVMSFQSQHKRPYERILFGAAEGFDAARFPAFRVLATPVLPQHSRKPPLAALLDSETVACGLPSSCARLEMFGRTLLPGWVTLGDQVLKFMDERYYALGGQCTCSSVEPEEEQEEQEEKEEL